MVLSLYKIHRKFGLRTVVVSTYQAVSGAGNRGIVELEKQEAGSQDHAVFVRKIHRNVVPVIGDILENSFSVEEMKMVNETRKILGDSKISIWPTTVRVPVMHGHSEAIFCETEKPFDLEDLRVELRASEDVV
jgi:aspartate-semialdehyde dehydrogenase